MTRFASIVRAGTRNNDLTRECGAMKLSEKNGVAVRWRSAPTRKKLPEHKKEETADGGLLFLCEFSYIL